MLTLNSNRLFFLALLMTGALLLIFPYALAAQNKEIKNVPISSSDASSGAAMYKTYCAVCHGTAGKGDGPAAAALKVAPGDLTRLSRNNGGKFPELRVYGILEGTISLPSHGNREMPMWGDLFRSLQRSDSSNIQLRLRNLTEYVKSIQAK